MPERIDLSEFFQTLTATAQHRISELNGQIDIDRSITTIISDRLALEQIFGNLIDNALKYRANARAPKINIRQAPSQWGLLTIYVEDNGRGIGEADRERVFDLFRRAGPQDQPGEGIGLAHVRALVRRIGGEITMTSELDRGTTFRVTLPQNLEKVLENAREQRG